MECPSDFTAVADDTCCGYCTKTTVTETLSGCDAVTCADCPSDYNHVEDGSCCGNCVK
jgi:hypothetical protein